MTAFSPFWPRNSPSVLRKRQGGQDTFWQMRPFLSSQGIAESGASIDPGVAFPGYPREAWVVALPRPWLRPCRGDARCPLFMAGLLRSGRVCDDRRAAEASEERANWTCERHDPATSRTHARVVGDFSLPLSGPSEKGQPNTLVVARPLGHKVL